MKILSHKFNVTLAKSLRKLDISVLSLPPAPPLLFSKMAKTSCKNTTTLDALNRHDDNIAKINDYNNNLLFGNSAPKTEKKILTEHELANLFESSLKMDETKVKYFESMDIKGAANYLLKCKSIVIMTGAGISTSVIYFRFFFSLN